MSDIPRVCVLNGPSANPLAVSGLAVGKINIANVYAGVRRGSPLTANLISGYQPDSCIANHPEFSA